MEKEPSQETFTEILKRYRNQKELDKMGNPPGTKHIPPTMSGGGYTGKTTQLSNGKIVPQKKSER
jgi:hypothetical protein